LLPTLHLLPCHDLIAVGAADPAFGMISLDGEKLVWQDSAIANMRDKLRSNFTVSNDGSQVRFGLGYGGERPVLFDLAAGRLTDQPQPAADLAEPDTTSLKLSDWEDNYTPKLDGNPLGLEIYETARSVAIATGAIASCSAGNGGSGSSTRAARSSGANPGPALPGA